MIQCDAPHPTPCPRHSDPQGSKAFSIHRHPQAGLISRGHSLSRAFFPSPAPIWGPGLLMRHQASTPPPFAHRRCHWLWRWANSDDAAGRARKATVARADARCLDADFP
ncbi:hypothetical protein V8C44DRAFT_318319 [Trichoderma aethiopicum]